MLSISTEETPAAGWPVALAAEEILTRAYRSASKAKQVEVFPQTHQRATILIRD